MSATKETMKKNSSQCDFFFGFEREREIHDAAVFFRKFELRNMIVILTFIYE